MRQVCHFLSNNLTLSVFFHYGVLFYGSGDIKVRNFQISVGSSFTPLPSMPKWKKYVEPDAWLLFVAWKDENSSFGALPVELVFTISEFVGRLTTQEFTIVTFTPSKSDKDSSG